MHLTHYKLIPKSGGWSVHPDDDPPGYRLRSFTMRAECLGQQLGGNNIQVVTGVPDKPRYGLDKEVSMWLPSGWWVTFRNQFARAPDIACEILESAADELSAITEQAEHARGVKTGKGDA